MGGALQVKGNGPRLIGPTANPKGRWFGSIVVIWWRSYGWDQISRSNQLGPLDIKTNGCDMLEYGGSTRGCYTWSLFNSN